MDIIFQSGEFYLDKTGSTFLGMEGKDWIQIIVTVALFFAGYLANRIVENGKEKKRLNEVKDYYSGIVKILNEPIDKQSNELKEFSDSLKLENEHFELPKRITSLHVQHLKRVNYEDLYKIFIQRDKAGIAVKTQDFQKLQAGVDYIEFFTNSLESNINLFRERFEAQEKEWKKNLNAIRELHDRLLTDFQKKHNLDLSNGRGIVASRFPDDKFLIAFSNLLTEWQKTGTSEVEFYEMYNAYKHFINKMWDLCRLFENDIKANEALTYAMNCMSAFDNIKHLKATYCAYFGSSYTKLQNSKTDMNDVVDKYSKY